MFEIQLDYEPPLVLCPDWRLLCLSSAQLTCCSLLLFQTAQEGTGPCPSHPLPVSLCPRLPLQSIPFSESKAVLSSAKPPPPGKMFFAGGVTQLWIWALWHCRTSTAPSHQPAWRGGLAQAQPPPRPYPSLPGHSSALQGPAAPVWDEMGVG